MPEQKDHKELGRQLALFYLSPDNPGMVLWYPKGTTLYNLIVDDLRKKLADLGYLEVKTPHVLNVELWKKSGHWDNFKDKMFFAGNDPQIQKIVPKWAVKPMNCPGMIVLFNSQMHSYKELPLYISEIGTVYRYEQPGEVNGLFRTRGFAIDDAHIFCQEDQIKQEVIKVIDFIAQIYDQYGFKEFHVELSTKPAKSIGTQEQWDKAENALRKALEQKKLKFKENPGEGAFYGPKIDFHIKDALGRSWQLSTIQVDFATAERLGAAYIDESGEKQTPVLIHRAILGSVERFLGILIEHWQGVFPVWLAPVQAIIAPITDRSTDYALEICKGLKKAGVRCEIDERQESIGKKIRDAELQKIPYILVVGDKEMEAQKVAVRERGKGDLGQMSVDEFLKKIKTND